MEVYEGGHCSDFPAPNRKHRQQNASLNLLRHIHRSRDDEAEEIDERCYFPLVNVDLTLPERYLENTPLLKRIYHVVDKASTSPSRVTVTLTDGRTFEGTVKGSDEFIDLAVVKIDPPKGKPLPMAPLGRSADLQVG